MRDGKQADEASSAALIDFFLDPPKFDTQRLMGYRTKWPKKTSYWSACGHGNQTSRLRLGIPGVCFMSYSWSMVLSF